MSTIRGFEYVFKTVYEYLSIKKDLWERSCSVVESTRSSGCELEPPCSVLVQPTKTRPDITEILLTGTYKSTQTNKIWHLKG